MQQVLARFPHLGDKIFQILDPNTLIRCKEVSRTWDSFIRVKKYCYLQRINWYTNFSESLINKIVEKFGGGVIVVSILSKIFGSNRPMPIGWEEREAHIPEGGKYYMNHITKSTQWEDPRITISHGNYQNSQHAQTSKISTSPPPYGFLWSKSPEGTISYFQLSEFIQLYDLPIPQLQQPSIPQFVNNHEKWELVWDNLTKKQKQSLLELQRQIWTSAISENFSKCNTGLLLSFFSIELPEEEEEEEENIILDPIASLAMDGWLRTTGIPISKRAFLNNNN